MAVQLLGDFDNGVRLNRFGSKLPVIIKGLLHDGVYGKCCKGYKQSPSNTPILEVTSERSGLV